MIPVEIETEDPAWQARKFGEGQEEYAVLPALQRVDDPRGELVSLWALSEEERAAVAAGANIVLRMFTYGHPLQPVALEVEGEEAAS